MSYLTLYYTLIDHNNYRLACLLWLSLTALLLNMALFMQYTFTLSWLTLHVLVPHLTNAYLISFAYSKKPCKYFDKGRGECPFNEKCFYLHAHPDGRIASPKPAYRRRRPPTTSSSQTSDSSATSSTPHAVLYEILAGWPLDRWEDLFFQLNLFELSLPSTSDEEDDDDDDDDFDDSDLSAILWSVDRLFAAISMDPGSRCLYAIACPFLYSLSLKSGLIIASRQEMRLACQTQVSSSFLGPGQSCMWFSQGKTSFHSNSIHELLVKEKFDPHARSVLQSLKLWLRKTLICARITGLNLCLVFKSNSMEFDQIILTSVPKMLGFRRTWTFSSAYGLLRVLENWPCLSTFALMIVYLADVHLVNSRSFLERTYSKFQLYSVKWRRCIIAVCLDYNGAVTQFTYAWLVVMVRAWLRNCHFSYTF